MNAFFKIIIFFLVVLMLFYMSFILIYYILGFMPFLKAKELQIDDIEMIKKYGVSHKTTFKGMNGIKIDKEIRGTKGRKAYSNHFGRAVYFFANAYVKKGEEFNDNMKYEYVINICNLTESQIKQIRIREYDNALMYLGDFKFEKTNKISYKKIEREKSNYSSKDLLHIKMDKYNKCLFGIAGIVFLLVDIPVIYLFIKMLI